MQALVLTQKGKCFIHLGKMHLEISDGYVNHFHVVGLHFTCMDATVYCMSNVSIKRFHIVFFVGVHQYTDHQEYCVWFP